MNLNLNFDNVLDSFVCVNFINLKNILFNCRSHTLRFNSTSLPKGKRSNFRKYTDFQSSVIVL